MSGASISEGPLELSAAAVDLTALVARISKMTNKVVQDMATLNQATTAMSQAMTEGFHKLQVTFAMLTKQVATNDVKVDGSLLELRKQLSDELGQLNQTLIAEITSRTVEQIMLTAVADVIDNAGIVLAQPATAAAAASEPVVHALRMLRDKLLNAFRQLGVEVVPIVFGTTQFDENLHECAAVAHPDDPSLAGLPAHVITGIYNQGYTMNGRTIKRARVVMKGD
jgi:molecular chaperone GrpE (heat shock protein)